MPVWRWGRKQREKQEDIWIAHTELPSAPGRPFYQRLNEVLEREKFDEFAEGRCAKFYAAKNGRPSPTPGIYVRSLLLGAFPRRAHFFASPGHPIPSLRCSPVAGSATGSPASTGYMAQISYSPQQNVQLAAQYTGNTRFNGLGTNYDGAGRNANGNNSTYLLVLFVSENAIRLFGLRSGFIDRRAEERGNL